MSRIGNTIFKRDSAGKIRQWRYQVDGARWCSHSGLVDGEQTQSGWTTCAPRSRPTAEEQALFEAEAEMGKKLDKDYAISIETVDEPRAFGAKVMLAQKYEPELFPETGPAYSQPKLDGIRCKLNRHGMWSRTGKPILSCPHIFAALSGVFVGSPDIEFDGELYNHELHDDFNKIVSLVRKSKPTDEDIAEAALLVQYHIYDVVRPDRTFVERDRMLDLFVPNLGVPEIVKVPTVEVRSPAEVDAAYGSYLAAGYEGQMVRINGPYESKRSKLLLKRKEFETREFELVSIEEGNGNWAGYAKRVVFRLDDGRECGAGIRGTQAQMRELLAASKDGLVDGNQVTIRYFTPTPDGMPRFPVAIDFNRED